MGGELNRRREKCTVCVHNEIHARDVALMHALIARKLHGKSKTFFTIVKQECQAHALRTPMCVCVCCRNPDDLPSLHQLKVSAEPGSC